MSTLLWSSIEELKPTTDEEELINKCRTGESFECQMHDDKLVIKIRADVLRCLLLGGDINNPMDPRGVRLSNAIITDELDVSFAHVKGNAKLENCRFEKPMIAREARLDYLDLSSSELPSLSLEGVEVHGDVMLRKTKIECILRLDGANINGQLDCDEISFEKFDRKEGAPDYLIKNQDKLWHEGKREISELWCDSGPFPRLNAQRLSVKRSFFFSTLFLGEARVDMRAANVGDLVDRNKPNRAIKPRGKKYLHLNGFTYDRIIGASLDLDYRTEWAKAGSIDKDPETNKETFHPQPFTQLALNYRRKGYHREAKRVLYRRDELRSEHTSIKDQYPELEEKSDNELAEDSLRYRVSKGFFELKDAASKWVTVYGHYPGRALWWILGLFLIAWNFTHVTWEMGAFAPNSGPVLLSTCWQEIAAVEEHPAKVWSGEQPPQDQLAGCPPLPEGVDRKTWWAQAAPGRDWESFSAIVYAADVVIPVIEFGQVDAWAPSTERQRVGEVLWYIKPWFTGLGWLFTAIGVAVLTRQIAEH